VIGGGTMDIGIAYVFAATGYDTALVEPNAEQADRARSALAAQARRAQERGRLGAAAATALPGRVGLAGTVLASNTSGLSIGEMAKGLRHPESFVGLHFFNPVWSMRLLEIVRGSETSDAVVDLARAVGEQIGSKPSSSATHPGSPPADLGGHRIGGHPHARRWRRLR
jgi:3-hydroxybutyryl-CoA dehydrogenase